MVLSFSVANKNATDWPQMTHGGVLQNVRLKMQARDVGGVCLYHMARVEGGRTVKDVIGKALRPVRRKGFVTHAVCEHEMSTRRSGLALLCPVVAAFVFRVFCFQWTYFQEIGNQTEVFFI